MKYILSQKEYDDLLAKSTKITEDGKRILQELCTLVADHMPVDWGWSPSDPPKPWGCMLTDPEEEWYCDGCPVISKCPYPCKRWSA